MIEHAQEAFDTIKIHKGERLEFEAFLSNLVAFGYRRCDQTLEEGDFSQRGEVIEIFPFNFELPIRIELNVDLVERIVDCYPVEIKERAAPEVALRIVGSAMLLRK